jgi:DNA-directed RNA polymerase specialized sigma24 family protein
MIFIHYQFKKSNIMEKFNDFHARCFVRAFIIAFGLAKGESPNRRSTATKLANDALYKVFRVKGRIFCLEEPIGDVNAYVRRTVNTVFIDYLREEKKYYKRETAFVPEEFSNNKDLAVPPIEISDEREEIIKEKIKEMPLEKRELLKTLSKQEMLVFRLILGGYPREDILRMITKPDEEKGLTEEEEKLRTLKLYRVIFSHIKDKLGLNDDKSG